MGLNLKTETVLSGNPAPARPPLPPETIAPHFPQLEILECLGRGGMGVVYKARQKSLNRLVALKLLAPERADDPKFAARFEKEAHALAALNHPHIVGVHDFGQAGGFYFLLMEFVDGVNLRQAMKVGRFTPGQALAVVPPVCEALQYAHERGIVHRDIKPENLLLDKQGRVKIADFGIAKILGAPGSEPAAEGGEPIAPNPSLVRQGDPTLASVAGTPQYMSPEQKAHGVTDHRADIYSLGVVLYELLTGELPADKLQPPSRKVQIDVRLDGIVLRALEKMPELRYQTAGEFRTQVETVVATPRPAPASPATPPPVLTPPVRPEPAPTNSPRFSRAALVGACWLVIVPLHFILPMVVPFGWAHNPVVQFLAALQALIFWTAPIGITVLGWIAASQIRRSAGKLHGMGLAVFDGLLFPLLAMNGVLLALPLMAIKLIPWHGVIPVYLILLLTLAGLGLLALLITANVFIIRRVWRAVNKDSVPVPQIDFHRTGGKEPQPNPLQAKSQQPSGSSKLGLATVLMVHGLLPLALLAIPVLLVPHFQALYSDLGVALPKATQLVLNLPRFLLHGGFLLIPVLLALNAGICWLLQRFAGRKFFTAWSVIVSYGCTLFAVFALYMLYLPLNRAIQVMGESEAGVAPQSITFGTEIELILRDPNESVQNSVVALGSGKLLTFPDDVKSQMLIRDANPLGPEASFWTKLNHADAMARVIRDGATIKEAGLRTYELLTVPAENDAWEQTTPAQLAEKIDKRLHESSFISQVSDLMTDGKTPKTFLFKTRDGKMGILQILGADDTTVGVKIRYKLVQTATTGGALKITGDKKGVVIEDAQGRKLQADRVEINTGTSAKVPEKPAFGPVMERVVPFGVPCEKQCLQFRSGRLFTNGHGPGTTKEQSAQDWKIIEDAGGVDVEALGLEDGLQFAGKGCVFTKGNSPDWEKQTAEDIVAVWRHASWINGVIEPKKTELPLTYLFKTSRGEMGILQLLDIVESDLGYRGSDNKGHGVKIRYKLVQGAAAAPAPKTGAQEVAPETGKAVPTDSTDRFELRWVALDSEAEAPADILQEEMDRGFSRKLRVLKAVVLDGSDVAGASQNAGEAAIRVKLSAEGARKFAAATAKNKGRQLAIVWNGRVLSAPTIQSAITGDQMEITGNLKAEESQLLLRVLNHTTAVKATTPTSPAGAAVHRRFPAIELFINNHRYGNGNGCSQTLLTDGSASCGHPGHVSEVSWIYLRSSPQGDDYKITRKYPADSDAPKTETKEITYTGEPLILWRDDFQKIILCPTTPPAPPAADAPGDAELRERLQEIDKVQAQYDQSQKELIAAMAEYSQELATRNNASPEDRRLKAESLAVKVQSLQKRCDELRARLDQFAAAQTKQWQYGQTLKALLATQEEAVLALTQTEGSPEDRQKRNEALRTKIVGLEARCAELRGLLEKMAKQEEESQTRKRILAHNGTWDPTVTDKGGIIETQPSGAKSPADLAAEDAAKIKKLEKECEQMRAKIEAMAKQSR